MDKEHSGSDLNPCQDNDNSQSLVGKLKKNVTEIISNTSLSKWFRKNDSISNNNSATVRRRQNDSDDEDFDELQPPAKRTKLPSSKETLSLNVSAVLSPISLKNTNLYKNFPEPIAGPSGYESRKKLLSGSTLFPLEDSKPSTSSRTVKINRIPSTRPEGSKELLNSDSEESTSGYSSGRVGSKEVISQESSKQVSPSQSQNSPLKNRSLFSSGSSGLFSTDRSERNTNSSMSSRVPSFNPSVCGSVNFADRTLASKRILNSPFYTGKTIYGGASAYGRNTQRVAEDVQKILRKSVSIKPTNTGMEKGNLPLGKTARRILDALEQYSSPISDAKKIPLDNKKKFEGMLTKFRGATPYTRFNSRSGGASSKELIVPSVTDLLKIKIEQQKSKLQDSTESVRQLATKTTDNTSSNKEQTYKLPVYDQKDRHVRKMRNKITSVRQKGHDLNNESVPELNLIPIVLPIKELPKFDGPLFPEKKATNSATNFPLIISKKTDDSNNDVVFKSSSSVKTKSDADIQSEFKFSDPVVLANCFKPLKALNNFKFSEPLVKKRKSIHPELDLEQENRNSEFIKRSNGENSIITQPSLVNLFKPKEGTWECSECFIRNQSGDKKCIACTNPRISSKVSQRIPSPISSKLQEIDKNEEKLPKSSSELFNKFLGTTKLPVTKVLDEWRCSICLIMNKNNMTKCAACENPNPNSNFGKTVTNSINKNDDNKKKLTNNWNCAVCMVPNKEDAEKCVCCETRNPNIEKTNIMNSSNKLKTTVCSFNFGIDKATASNFLFGIPQGTDQQTLLSATKTNTQLVFGGEKKAEEPSKDAPISFLFGVQPEFQKQEEIKSSQPFGTTTEETAAKKPTIGDNTSEKPVPFPFIAPKSVDKVTSSFSFGSTIPKTDNKNAEINKTLNTTIAKAPEKTGEFLFGLPKAATSSVSSLPSIFNKPINKSPQKRSKPDDEVATAGKIPSFNFTATNTSLSSTNGDVNQFGKSTLETNIASTSVSTNITGNSNFSFAPKSAISTICSNTDTIFGNVANKPQQPFKFGASSDLPKPTNGFGFGSSSATSTSAAFGSLSSTTNNNDLSVTSSFGGGVLQKPSPQFGAFDSEPAKQRPFSFGENTTNKSSFFSTNNNPPPPSTAQTPSSFNFNSTVPQFGFQGITQQPKPENSLFGLSVSSSVPSFVVPSSVHSFGNNNPNNTAVNGTLNFGGATSNNNKATFSFGANNGSGEHLAANKSGGFNFESASAMNANATFSAAAPSGGGFSFSAVAAAPSAFDAISKPSFNFTGGSAPASFSAPPLQDGTMPQRKYKKAIRRTLR